MAIFFKVLSCPSPQELFSGIRSFCIHELSPPGGLLMYWSEAGRCYFPFRPRPAVWYHRPRLNLRGTGRFRLIARCFKGQPTAQLVVEVH